MALVTVTTFFLPFLVAFLVQGGTPSAAVYPLDGAVIGKETTYRIAADETLYEVAREHDIGVSGIIAANPGIDPVIPAAGSLILIPAQWILPDVTVTCGIVINIAEMRLYLFDTDNPTAVTSYPVGIGDTGSDTPLGTFAVVEKITDPSWYVPRSIRKERPELPAVVPAGPENPMGNRALRLSLRTVLIHGTNRPFGIGTRNSHGCIRLYPEDIERLFSVVPLGMPVTIVDQPVKATRLAGRVFLQVHDHRVGRDLYREALRVLDKQNLLTQADRKKVKNACRQRRGQLVDVTAEPTFIPGHFLP